VVLSFHEESGARKSTYPPPCLYERHPDGSVTVLAPMGSRLFLEGQAAKAFRRATEWREGRGQH
jgi:hypothetical protein